MRQREWKVIRKALFLIGNRHFLIRKRRFGVRQRTYVLPYSAPHYLYSLIQGVLPMIRRRLLVLTAIVASAVLTACSDMTAPKNDDSCPVVNGSSTCKR